jgi:arsenate reductase
LAEKAIEFESVNYLERPLTVGEFKKLLHSAGLKPQDAMRKNEPSYRELVGRRQMSDDELIAVMVKHPELIQRPIVARGSKAVLARPAEKLAELGI